MKIFDEDEPKLESRGVETLSVQPKFETLFSDVATRKANLGAVKESQNEIRTELGNLEALQTAISKNLEGIILRQEDMLTRQEAAIK